MLLLSNLTMECYTPIVFLAKLCGLIPLTSEGWSGFFLSPCIRFVCTTNSCYFVGHHYLAIINELAHLQVLHSVTIVPIITTYHFVGNFLQNPNLLLNSKYGKQFPIYGFVPLCPLFLLLTLLTVLA